MIINNKIKKLVLGFACVAMVSMCFSSRMQAGKPWFDTFKKQVQQQLQKLQPYADQISPYAPYVGGTLAGGYVLWSAYQLWQNNQLINCLEQEKEHLKQNVENVKSEKEQAIKRRTDDSEENRKILKDQKEEMKVALNELYLYVANEADPLLELSEDQQRRVQSISIEDYIKKVRKAYEQKVNEIQGDNDAWRKKSDAMNKALDALYQEIKTGQKEPKGDSLEEELSQSKVSRIKQIKSVATEQGVASKLADQTQAHRAEVAEYESGLVAVEKETIATANRYERDRKRLLEQVKQLKKLASGNAEDLPSQHNPMDILWPNLVDVYAEALHNDLTQADHTHQEQVIKKCRDGYSDEELSKMPLISKTALGSLIEHYIKRGGALAYRLAYFKDQKRIDKKIPLGTKENGYRDYLESIVSLLWYLFFHGDVHTTPYTEGMIVIHDPKSHFYSFLHRYVTLCNKGSRMSSHFKNTGQFNHYGFDVPNGMLLPAQKEHVLFGRVQQYPNLTFIKIENKGISNAQDGVVHTREFVQGMGRKQATEKLVSNTIWNDDDSVSWDTCLWGWVQYYVGDNDDPHWSKEHTPANVRIAFGKLLKQKESGLEKKDVNDLAITQAKKFGIAWVIHRARQFADSQQGSQAWRDLMMRFAKNLAARYTKSNLRFGSEAFYARDDLFVSYYYYLLEKCQIEEANYFGKVAQTICALKAIIHSIKLLHTPEDLQQSMMLGDNEQWAVNVQVMLLRRKLQTLQMLIKNNVFALLPENIRQYVQLCNEHLSKLGVLANNRDNDMTLINALKRRIGLFERTDQLSRIIENKE